MQYFHALIGHYGLEGAALAVVILVMLFVQLYYYLVVYARIAGYKNNRRQQRLAAEPPLSVVIPMFSEDYPFVEERLPLILKQEYPDFEVVIVYVGHDNDFFEDLSRLKQFFPQVVVTKIELNPRFPISVKMALNVGIKSAHNEHLIFSTTDACPRTDRWLSLMGKGFMRGEIVVGYCGLEPRSGLTNYFMRMWRMMHAADWLSAAVRRHPYRGIRHNLGLTKSLYFGANGFNRLNMNIGEDDLFMQKIMTRDNVSVILSPRASLHEKCWGGLRWWFGTLRYYGSTEPFYPLRVRNFVRDEMGSRVLFFAAVICALVCMPWEYKIAAGIVLLLRYAGVAVAVSKIARRLGEPQAVARYFLYDLLSPLFAGMLRIASIRRDGRVWR